MNTVLNWSSGKDAAMAYQLLQNDQLYNITHLLTTINEEQDRIVMHGVRESLLDAQAAQMGIQLCKIKLPPAPSDDVYRSAMTHVLEDLKQQGVEAAAFGDIFLEDLKTYREQQLMQIGIQPVFPLWKMNTLQLIGMLEDAGIEAIIVCLSEQHLSKDFLGREIDRSFLEDIPANVDPCGENGEFHTFVYNAPFFKSPVSFNKGETVYRTYNNNSRDTGFYFLDLY